MDIFTYLTIVVTTVLIIFTFAAYRVSNSEISFEQEPEKKICNHDTCYECKHLIEKGSGQKVIMVCSGWEFFPPYSWSTLHAQEIEVVFCDLHKKSYDRFESDNVARERNHPPIYEKRIDPWKRVNADGSDYVEPVSTTS